MFEFDRGSLNLSQFSLKLKNFHSNSQNVVDEYASIFSQNVAQSNTDFNNVYNQQEISENYNLDTNYENFNFSTADICNTFTEENEIILDKFVPKFSTNIQLYTQTDVQYVHSGSNKSGKGLLDDKLSIEILSCDSNNHSAKVINKKTTVCDSIGENAKKNEKNNNYVCVAPLKYYNKNKCQVIYYCLLCHNHGGITRRSWTRHVKVCHSNKTLHNKNYKNINEGIPIIDGAAANICKTSVLYKSSKDSNGISGTKKSHSNKHISKNSPFIDNLESILNKTLRKMTVMELIRLTTRYCPYLRIRTFDKCRLVECLMTSCNKERVIVTHKHRWRCYVYTR
ncbi:hypothetical protein BMR1_03g00861 [Babesia microti strain RI]|uniref:Uncharacterized protein n=1 Tax=Babesia microti (strain RI) TaxID=1133968 RepID=A0A1R4ABG9_BABMR|nr:hypothetical protein BMR1_03g00861 [Babesia microti strain RI]SJK86285.1 hypothetical protein BMR1_03g00861 [Babesia microti strain RI]|eukprot:XP_021338461.1 hypothetical protein BMR1_03g00861 [Babesia microti strain RI]